MLVNKSQSTLEGPDLFVVEAVDLNKVLSWLIVVAGEVFGTWV